MAIQLSGSLAITGSLVATSQIVAQTLNVQQVTSSIVYSSGSNIFGNSVSNTQQFTGSLQVSGSTSYILGNVGIGTTSPAYKLDVQGTGRFTGQLRLESTITDGTYTYTLPSATGTLALTSALSGMITGSGTTNYLPKFTGTSTIGNSQVFDNGTNVGIGTASVSGTYEKLAVAGGISIKDNTNAKFEIGRYNTTGAQNSYIKLGANSNSLRITNNTDIADILELTNSGNLGLGVTPSAWSGAYVALQVGGVGSLSTTTGGATFTHLTNGAYYNGTNWIYNYTSVGVARYTLTDSGGGTHQWFTAPNSGTAGNAISFTQAMTLTSTSKLLLNTTSDAGDWKLQVNGSAYFTNTNSVGYTYLTIGNSGASGRSYDIGVGGNGVGSPYQNSFYVYDNIAGQPRFYIASTGAATFSSTVLLYDELRIRNTSYGASYNTSLRSISGATGVLQLGNNDTNYILAGNTAAGGYLIFRVNCASESITAGSEAMRITSGGNVGIGTTSPGAKLDVATTAAGYAAILTNTNGASDSNGLLVRAGSTSSEYVVRFAPQSDASTFFTVKGNGNVGIGTTSPSWLLQLEKNSTSGGAGQYPALVVNNPNAAGYSAMYFFNGGTNVGGLEYSNTSTNLLLNAYGALLFQTASGTERMRITSGGNVGIGTSSPSTKLEVEDGFISTYHNINANGAGYGLQFYTNGGGSKNTIASIDISQVGTARSGTLIFNTSNAGAPTEKMRITSGGDVLIGGTTGAAVRLGAFSANNTSSSYSFVAWNASGADMLSVRGDGLISTGTGTLSPYNFTTGTGANMVVDSSGYLYRSTSSLKYKTNVTDYDKGLDIITKMKPVYYNSKNNGDTLFAGLIAEDIHELGLTEFVQYAEDGSPDALSYSNMVALLIKGMQEQQKQIEAQQQQINSLINK